MSIPGERSSLLTHSSHILNDQPSAYNRSSSSVAIQQNNEPGLPIRRAVFVVTNAALGAGMLAFPEAYGKTGGVPAALAVQAVRFISFTEIQGVRIGARAKICMLNSKGLFTWR